VPDLLLANLRSPRGEASRPAFAGPRVLRFRPGSGNLFCSLSGRQSIGYPVVLALLGRP
jgi:hypothetical protein